MQRTDPGTGPAGIGTPTDQRSPRFTGPVPPPRWMRQRPAAVQATEPTALFDWPARLAEDAGPGQREHTLHPARGRVVARGHGEARDGLRRSRPGYRRPNPRPKEDSLSRRIPF